MKSVNKEFNNKKASILLEAEPSDNGKRLDECVKSYLVSQSRETIKKMIQDRQVKITNRITKNKVHTKIRHMDLIEVCRFNLNKKTIKLKTLFDDEYLVAVDKPKGMPVHPTGMHHFNVVSTILESDFKRKLYPVHRLDIKTSGVLILAKDKITAKAMGNMFESKKIKKVYKFKSKRISSKDLPKICTEKISEDKNSTISLKRTCSFIGKASLTEFRNVEYFENYIKGVAIPVTGRLHQIRCHLSHLGFPIIGDEIYGDGDKEDVLELHCESIDFIHPIFKKRIYIRS